MKSFLKDSEEITFLEKAELGLLDDRLEVAEIATLAFPDNQKFSRAVETGIIKAIHDGELGYCRRVPLISPGEWNEDMAEEPEEQTYTINWGDVTISEEEKQALNESMEHMAQTVIRSNEGLERLSNMLAKEFSRIEKIADIAKKLESPKISFSTSDISALDIARDFRIPTDFYPKPTLLEPGDRDLYWIKRQQLKAYFIARDEWPLEGDGLLADWFADELGMPPSNKRESDLPRYVSQVIKEMIKEGNEKPTYKEIWRYIEEHEDEFEWVDEMTEDTLYWITVLGKRNPIRLNAFRKTVTKAKKLL